MEGAGLLPGAVKASRVIGTITLTAIMLVSAVAAIEVLEIRSLETMMTEVVALASRVIFGLVIIAIGILLARLLTNIMSSATGETGLLATILRWLIIGLFAAMGLTFMQVGEQIVIIAFGAIVGSAAIAAAIAFGSATPDGAQAARTLDRRQSRPDQSGRQNAARHLVRTFGQFACFDWSGQAVARPKGIALAVAGAGADAPALVASSAGETSGWSRSNALDWLRARASERADMVIGFDFSFALPFADRGAYFPAGRAAPAMQKRFGGASTNCAPTTLISRQPALSNIASSSAISGVKAAAGR